MCKGSRNTKTLNDLKALNGLKALKTFKALKVKVVIFFPRAPKKSDTILSSGNKSPKISSLLKLNKTGPKQELDLSKYDDVSPAAFEQINADIRDLEKSALVQLEKGYKSVSEYLKKSSNEQRFYVLRAIIYKGLYKEYYGLFLRYSRQCKNIQDDENRNLLILAAIYGCDKLVAFLVTKIKMNLYKKKKGGLTAYKCALQEGDEKIALFLADFMGIETK